MLQNTHLLKDFGFDTAENEPAENLYKIAKQVLKQHLANAKFKFCNFCNFANWGDEPEVPFDSRRYSVYVNSPEEFSAERMRAAGVGEAWQLLPHLLLRHITSSPN